MRAFERDIVASGIHKILQLELAIRPEGWSTSLRGCGMLVVNPPFRFEDEAAAMLEWLWHALTREGYDGRRVRWLVPE